MNKQINLYIIGGIFFTTILGTILHFVYEWSGYNPIVGLFSPVNESVWEHLKLLYYPVTLWVIFGYFKLGRKNKNFIFASFAGLMAGIIAIPVLYYIYTAILGTNFLVVDILIFIASVVICFLTMGYILKNYNIRTLSLKSGILLWELLFILFVVFTIFPPNIFLFKS